LGTSGRGKIYVTTKTPTVTTTLSWSTLIHGNHSVSSFCWKRSGNRLFSSAPIPRSPPPMFDSAVRRSFPQVLERAQSHPHEASYLHPRGWTTLHCCVEYDAPMDVIQAVYEAFPEALLKVDYRGQTPLDLALSEDCQDYLSRMQKRQQEVVDETEEKQCQTRTNSINTTQATINHNINQQYADDGKKFIMEHVENISKQITNLQTSCKLLEEELNELKKKLE